MLFACAYLPQGKRAAICTDNVTDVSSKDDQSDLAQYVNSVDSFICQSTIIPADGRGFRMAISSQSISLADTFIGKMFVHWQYVAVWPPAGINDFNMSVFIFQEQQ